MTTTRRRPARRRRPAAPKVPISIRLQPATLATFRATGRGWQTFISASLDALAARMRGWQAGTHA